LSGLSSGQATIASLFRHPKPLACHSWAALTGQATKLIGLRRASGVTVCKIGHGFLRQSVETAAKVKEMLGVFCDGKQIQ
jgi:hypothetical protein